ncbi:MAG: MFS transporter, partial [Bacilli bacterium]
MPELLRNSIFTKLFLSQSISSFGDSMYYISLLTFASTSSNPSLAIMIVTLSEVLPQLLSPFISTYADRTKNFVIGMISADFIRFLLYGCVTFFIGYEPTLLILLTICTFNFVSDLLGTYSGGIGLYVLKHVVREDQLVAANGIWSSSTHIITLFGRLTGGGLLLLFGFQLFAAINAFTFLLCGLIILGIQKQLHTKVPPRSVQPVETSSFKQVKHAFKELFAQRKLI